MKRLESSTVSDNLAKEAIKSVKDAGALLLDFLGKKHSYKEKSDGSFVTEADLVVEHFLHQRLSALLPGCGFLSEESIFKESDEYNWVLDPLDGTTNFAHGFSYFSISLALTHKDRPILGIIYDPARGELFRAQRGKGAFLGDRSLSVSNCASIGKALVSIAIPYRKSDFQELFSLTSRLQSRAYSTRMLGCASMDLAYVAAGRLDASILKYVNWWDVAAGVLMVSEAGGLASEFDRDSIGRQFTTCLASNIVINKDLKSLLWS